MEAYPVVAGDLSGKMDRTVFYRLFGRCYGRKSPQPKDGGTRAYPEEMLEQQARFGFAGMVGKVLKHVLRISMPNPPKPMSAVNRFVELNIDNCAVVDEAGDQPTKEMKNGKLVTFDYESAVIAEGSMVQPQVTVSFTEGENQFLFTLPALSGREYPGKQATDKVYAVFVEARLLKAYVVELGTRGDGGTASEPLENGWSKDTTHVYAFATDEKGKETSGSVHLSFE